MLRLGYHRIGGYENDQPSSRTSLVSVSGSPHEINPGDAVPFLWFDFGFEAESVAVQRLVDPADPEGADELWLAYEPAAGNLELHCWETIAAGRVNWDIWRDSGPCSPVEVRRRLSSLGDAVDEFVEAAGGAT